jgi:2-dehydropantoate 2-reductase
VDVAILGAGRIGSTFAHRLARAGHAVTVVARGARLEALRRDPVIATVDAGDAPVRVASALDPAVAFDLVVVTVQAHQVAPLLPRLQASAAKSILFLFNTFGSLDSFREQVGAERSVFGFPTMIANFVDGKLKATIDGPGMATTLSSPEVAEVLAQAGLPTEIEADMSSFLRSHAAFVVPLMAAGHLTWNRGSNLTWTEAALAWLPSLFRTALLWILARTSSVKQLGEFGPAETQNLIDAMTSVAPHPLPELRAIRPD